MNLRKHQKHFAQIIDGIITGNPIKTIICEVTLGGGKSALPIIAGKRTDKRLITFSFVKKYCPYRQHDKHSMIDRCPKIERTSRAKLHPLCTRKDCFIWNGLESNELSDEKRDSLLLEKIEKLIE